MSLDRAGERAARMSEELGFEQVRGDGTAVTATNAISRRRLAWWIARASSSLPVPDSPKIRTLASESATSFACRSRSSIRALRVMMPARHSPAA